MISYQSHHMSTAALWLYYQTTNIHTDPQKRKEKGIPSNQQDSIWILHDIKLYFQWPFQEPKLEVPTIYKAYIRPM
jgi:hypothetical protein